MAQQAVMMMVFLFIMCLSSMCSSALGGGVFYACSDGTLDINNFDFKKCTNFGLQDVKAVVSGDIKEPTVETPSELTEQASAGDDLLPPQPIDEEAADPNLPFIDYFTKSRTRFSGNGVTASASNAAECAKICYNDEVTMPNEGEKCQGFISDDGTYCKLYPTVDSTEGDINSRHKAYRLKESKEGGGDIAAYNTTRRYTEYTSNGGPMQYGSRHDVNCGGSGALSSFKFNTVGGQVNNSFVCLNSSEKLSGSESKQTGVNASGKEKGRNDMYWIDRHDVNCGNKFLKQWKLDQWSHSMRVNYTCSTTPTPRPDECETLSASGYSAAGDVGSWKGNEVKCPANKLLTQWHYTSDRIDYTCCPKP